MPLLLLFFGSPKLRLAVFLLLVIAPLKLHAEDALVAVAINFSAPAKEIAAAFKANTQHNVTLSFGSTGKLYAQIANGAPYHAYLAADAQRPARAIEHNLAVEGTAFTYAKGKIVLFSALPNVVDTKGEILRSPQGFNKIAIANPKIAPYGAAAVQVMQELNTFDLIKEKMVIGENIAQTYQFISTGNAELGFIAQAQLKPNEQGSYWIPPTDMYTPLNQNAVLLRKGKTNPAAQAFLLFLKSEEAKNIIARYGYELASPR